MKDKASVIQVSFGRERSVRLNILYIHNLCEREDGFYI